MPKAFDPNSLPKGFPPDGLMNQHGKPYITHVGLVWLANHRGKPWSGTIVSQEIKWNQAGQPHAAVVVFKVWDDEQEHTDIGDACGTNVGKMIVPHLVRMASTRAQNRALRAFVGYAGCTADELELGEAYEGSDASAEAPPQNGRREEPRAAKSEQKTQSPSFNIRTNSPYKCPACGGSVWDNRGSDKKGPIFGCSRGGACAGGNGRFGWGEWDNPDFFKDSPEDLAHQVADHADMNAPVGDGDIPF
jgi:hypothetical protein